MADSLHVQERLAPMVNRTPIQRLQQTDGEQYTIAILWGSA
jgi:hypothetical protein